jgi:glutamate---cysteine ligase / carboxylate-amine ligase
MNIMLEPDICGTAADDRDFCRGRYDGMTSYRFGIEEEYFISDLRTRTVRNRMSKRFFRACKKELGDAVMNEMLQSQIEVATTPCATMSEARTQLHRFRRRLAEHASGHGLGIIAAATHPLSLWHEQEHTAKDRYASIMADLQMVGRRDMLCGMHVHVELPDPGRRVEIMYRAIPFLPVLLALSTSSPFWQGHSTGLRGYRLAAYDELPRSGFPDLFKTLDEYQQYVDTLVAARVIEDASYIWWVIRPALHHPTLELRIPDACTRVEDAICIAALFRCLMRHLCEKEEINVHVGAVARAIASENKWRAQRYGTSAMFVDEKSVEAVPLERVVGNLIERLEDDARALDCTKEVAHATQILKRGSSADQQLRVYEEARALGLNRIQALKSVVDWLYQETIQEAIQEAIPCPAKLSEEGEGTSSRPAIPEA